MSWIFGSFISFLIGSPLYMPWVLVRIGKYKSWYLAHFAPPFIWGRAVYIWPLSAMFIFGPVVGLLPMFPSERSEIMGIISMFSIVAAGYMVVWTPAWAKPKWQRILEKKYSWLEIRGVFIPVWRKMDRQKWSELLDSEEGIAELIQYARNEKEVNSEQQ